MEFLLLALVVGLFVAIPWFLTGRFAGGIVLGSIITLMAWAMFYSGVPTLAGPFWGTVGGFCMILGAVSGVVAALSGDDSDSSFPGLAYTGLLLVALFGRMLANSEIFNASGYAAMLGTVDERVWTQDVQPKDAKHIRLVPFELAGFLADKQLGSADSAIGSQFSVDKDRMTLQIVNGELWYVAPLDFNGFSVWQTKGVTPGYVKVHGEDPTHPPVVVTDKSFRYMPGAYFGDNLERHIWRNGYASKLITDYTFEITDDGAPVWTATVSEPTIGWWAPRVLGVVTVNPSDGHISFVPYDKVATETPWLDRVVPRGVAWDYITWWGTLRSGWLNSWWGTNNLIKPEGQSLIYGSDGDPWWVTSLTSTNNKDESLVGLIYTDVRTGRHISYKAQGATEAGVLTAINNKVAYKKLHGSGPVLYNVYGTMAYIVPLLGESHTFQGVAIANVENLQVAVGDNAGAAFRDYQRLLAEAGSTAAAESRHDVSRTSGIVERFACELRGTSTLCYVKVVGTPHLFTGDSTLSAKLPVTQRGDEVLITYTATGEDVEPMLSFDNTSITLEKSTLQSDVDAALVERKEAGREHKQLQTDEGELKNLTPAERRVLLDLRKQLGKRPAEKP